MNIQGRAALIALAIGILVTLGLYAVRFTGGELKQDSVQPPAPGAAAPQPNLIGARAAPASAATGAVLAPDDLEFLEQLRTKFGSVIRGKHAQIKAIEQLVAYLMERYPDDWADRVRAMLDQLFPELAAELYDKFVRLMQYNDWLRLHREELTEMSVADRRRALLNARREAFGAAAAEIWAAELRNERIHESLVALDSADGKTIAEKTAVLLDAVKQAYGDQAELFIQNRQTELLSSFLDVASVQNELRAMPAAERSTTLRGVRSTLGMDQAALDRWSELDRTRDQSWNQGQSYMQERGRIIAQHQGDEQLRLLQQLQERTFGAEAETIRNEEQAGFFRYGHTRRIGRE